MPVAARQRAPLTRVAPVEASDYPASAERAPRARLAPFQAHPSAERQRRYRARRRSGLVTLSVECDEVGLAEMLVHVGYLSPADADERGALTRALEKAIADFTIVVVTDDA